MDPSSFGDKAPGQVIWTPAGQHWAFIPDSLPPRLTWTPTLVNALSQADRALGELAGLGRSLPNPHLLIRPFVRREAVLSSRIEGTQASLSDVYAFEVAQLALFRTPPDVREVVNYVDALEWGLKRLDEIPFSLRLIKEIHARLMSGVRGEWQTPGKFRRTQNWIGSPGAQIADATFVPPPTSEMIEALGALERYVHAPDPLPPLIRLGLIHYQFEVIHPFLDGNGRMGRLLVSLLLCAWNLMPQPLLYLSVYFEKHRETYYDLLLAVSQQGEWERWLVFFLNGVASQSQDAITRSDRLQQLRERYRSQFQSARTAARLLQVVDLLFSQPILTVRQVQTVLDANFPAAQRYVDRLVDAGILEEITGQTRNRVYRAREILRTLEAPLSSEAREIVFTTSPDDRSTQTGELL